MSLKRWFVKFTDPKRRGHAMPCHTTGDHKGSTGVCQEAEGEGQIMGKGLYCGFHQREREGKSKVG